jgi:hypothetical protein
MTTNPQILWRHPKGQQHVDAPCSETVDTGTERLSPLRGKDGSLAIGKCLPKNSLIRLVGDHRGERIACVKGRLWITQSGNAEDIILCAGEAFTITQKGTLLIEGLVETRLKITRLSLPRSSYN